MNPIVKAIFGAAAVAVLITFPVLLIPAAGLAWTLALRARRQRQAGLAAREALEASPTYRQAYEDALWAQQRPVAVRQLHLVGQPVPAAPASGRRASTTPERVAVVSRVRPAPRHAR